MTTLPLKWHGGKNYLAKDIIDLMPRHLHYVEPYAGGLAVLLNKDPFAPGHQWGTKSHEQGTSEVVSDIDGELTNFWRVLQNPRQFNQFQRRVQAIPFSQAEWKKAAKEKGRGPIDRAVRLFVLCRQSMAGRMQEFAPLSRTRTRRGMNEQASAWMTAVDGLPEVADRLHRVVVLNDEALNVIRKEDGPKTLFYCDPPYLHQTRTSKDTYRFEMNEQDHRELLILVSRVKGKVILSGYRSELYDSMLRRPKWHRREFNLPNNAAGGKSKRRMTECVWMNYKP